MFDVLDLETSILAIDIELEDYTEDIENTINSPHDIVLMIWHMLFTRVDQQGILKVL